MNVRTEGQNKVIVLEAPFPKNQSKETNVFDVIASESQSEDVAVIEDALAAHRAEIGDENATLKDIYLTVCHIKHNQVQLIRVGQSDPKIIEPEVVEYPVESKDTFTEDELTFQKLLLTSVLINQNHNSFEL